MRENLVKTTTTILMLSLLAMGTIATLAPTAAAVGACAQANTFVAGMFHSCPLGYPDWEYLHENPCYFNVYDNTVGERTGVLVWWC